MNSSLRARFLPTRRLMKEFEDLQHRECRYFRDIQVTNNDLMTWEGLLVPNKSPYNKGAFRIEIHFPKDYPFKPPTVTLKTKIYHPNVDEQGHLYLSTLRADIWKPVTTIHEVLQELLDTVNNPRLEHALRPDLAEEYVKDNRKFYKNAKKFTKKYAEMLPLQLSTDPPLGP